MKYTIKLLLAFSLAIIMVATPLPVSAAVNYNRLMDDFVFSNSSKMTAAQIDSWLNTNFPNSCISTNKGFSANEPTGYTPSPSEFHYGSRVSAGKVIYTSAKVYGLNPQVILATLQKEEGLIDGGAGCATWRYASAMGYACTDSGSNTHDYSYPANLPTPLYYINGNPVNSINDSCVESASKAGFSEQVIHAAWLLRFSQQRSLGNTAWDVQLTNFPHVGNVWDNSDDPDSCYGGPMTQGYRKRCSDDPSATYYDGYTTIDGSSVHMDTGATASFYRYTPHKSGNANFVNIFTNWFGSTLSNPIKISVYKNVSGEDGSNYAKIGFSLVQQPTNNVVIPLEISDSTEGSFSNSSSITSTNVTITSASWNTPTNNVVRVYGRNDSLNDGDINYWLITHTPSSADVSYGNLKDKDIPNVNLLNQDNESDIALTGDWNHDRKTTIGLRRGYTNMINNNFDGHTDYSFNYGSADYNNGSSNSVLVGDWNGDGRDEVGFKVGNYYYLNYGNDGHTDKIFQYGMDTDVPLVGDWNGDSKDTISLRRGYTNFVNNGLDGRTDFTFNYGSNTDVPLVGDWNGDSKDTVALRSGSTYRINNSLDGRTDFTFNYGR